MEIDGRPVLTAWHGVRIRAGIGNGESRIGKAGIAIRFPIPYSRFPAVSTSR
ncbi:hypothetical protein AZ78_2066 [Lysobacter capsici AZ78]|uniref:Uncharacterized protein n=1 Tax=Lysobacter capsici AZ78 TaxID=1444315 RepID=A0A108U8J3_9GAMM|nr:hypothetical protein AZ78_2066 [Lysobacter capsici AZ78]